MSIRASWLESFGERFACAEEENLNVSLWPAKNLCHFRDAHIFNVMQPKRIELRLRKNAPRKSPEMVPLILDGEEFRGIVRI